MASDTLPEQRTELPTDRRMGEIRKEGAIHHSAEVVQVLSLLAGFITLGFVSSAIQRDMVSVLKKSFALIANPEPLTAADLRFGFIKLVILVAPNVLLLTVIVAIVAFFSTMLQTNWTIREKWIKFRWDFLNPVAGLARMFSLNQLIQTGKAILKLACILPIGYYALESNVGRSVMLIHTSIPGVVQLAVDGIDLAFWRIFYVLIALAAFDYFWGRYRWFRQNNMTKDEVKDERKATEGDETMRRKMISIGMQRIYKKIAQAVPKADVVITNPTHFAVALKYERGKNAAPQVVAKGADFLAAKIREIARQNGVPVLERKALARALYSSTKVGQEVPRELFKAVAEVLAYVYRIKNPNSGKGALNR